MQSEPPLDDMEEHLQEQVIAARIVVVEAVKLADAAKLSLFDAEAALRDYRVENGKPE